MPDDNLLIALTALAAITVLAATALRGWQGWLALKTRELAAYRGEIEHAPGTVGMGSRIEIADLKERIRKLEAIAAGVDL